MFDDKKLVLFGVGNNDRSITNYLIKKLKQSEISIEYCIDNFYKEHIYKNIPVYGPEKLLSIDRNKVFILVTSIGSSQKISSQLINYGFVEGVNFNCVADCNEIFNKIEYEIFKKKLK